MFGLPGDESIVVHDAKSEVSLSRFARKRICVSDRFQYLVLLPRRRGISCEALLNARICLTFSAHPSHKCFVSSGSGEEMARHGQRDQKNARRDSGRDRVAGDG
jgi:hypothetical protein